MSRVVDFIRRLLLAVEDEIGRDLHEQRVHFVCGAREKLDRRTVDRVRDRFILLRLIDFRVSGAIDDDRRAAFLDERRHAARIGDVEIRFRERDQIFAARGELIDEIAADHAAGAGDHPPMHH